MKTLLFHDFAACALKSLEIFFTKKLSTDCSIKLDLPSETRQIGGFQVDQINL
jgi:hypothetical protein